jgi:hypothetical protein
MKQFLIEWCKNMIIALVLIGYISIFFAVCYLLDDNTLKGAIYIFLWVVFYAVTTVTCYVRYFYKK